MISKRRGQHTRSRASRTSPSTSTGVATTESTSTAGRGWLRLGPIAVAAFLMSAMLFSTPGGGVLHSAASADTPVANCPGGVSQCVSVTPSGCTSSCPTVIVGPTTNVGQEMCIRDSGTDRPFGLWEVDLPAHLEPHARGRSRCSARRARGARWQGHLFLSLIHI